MLSGAKNFLDSSRSHATKKQRHGLNRVHPIAYNGAVKKDLMLHYEQLELRRTAADSSYPSKFDTCLAQIISALTGPAAA